MLRAGQFKLPGASAVVLTKQTKHFNIFLIA
jgi:hypothetical protein